jgi:hypothetical protein
MNQNFIELVNFVQTVPYDQKKQIYSIYKEMIPKRKMFFKWIKSNTKKKPTTLVEYVAKYFECSLGEAEEYIDILRENGVRSVLYEMGLDEKEAKKLMK